MKRLLLIVVLAILCNIVLSQSCDINEIFVIKRCCELDRGLAGDDPVYIMYSVNPAEGFNLRRDVYLRMAIFLKNLRQIKGYSRAVLVLPVFHHL